MEEVHRATMSQERASNVFGVLAQPGEKMCVFVWDGFPVKIEQPSNHHDGSATFSTKHHGHSLNRIEAVDLEGRPVFTLNLSASISPRATDESMSFFNLDTESTMGLQGGFIAMLVGLPGYLMIHLFDNGFR